MGLKAFEIEWKPLGYNAYARVDIVSAPSMEEAIKKIEGMAKCYGATGIELIRKSEFSKS